MLGRYHCSRPQGLKAGVSASLLGISAQTLRYWRANLDPEPKTTHFSAGRLLAYNVLKVLIRHRFIPVELLKRCDFVPIFECCENVALSVLERCYLHLDAANGVIVLSEESPVIARDDFDTQSIALIGIVKMHRVALSEMGMDASQMRQDLRVR